MQKTTKKLFHTKLLITYILTMLVNYQLTSFVNGFGRLFCFISAKRRLSDLYEHRDVSASSSSNATFVR
jgi:hypothetical protein